MRVHNSRIPQLSPPTNEGSHLSAWLHRSAGAHPSMYSCWRRKNLERPSTWKLKHNSRIQRRSWNSDTRPTKRRLWQRSHRSEYFAKILGGSIYSTNLYQTMTYMILQWLIWSRCVVILFEPKYFRKILDAMRSHPSRHAEQPCSGDSFVHLFADSCGIDRWCVWCVGWFIHPCIHPGPAQRIFRTGKRVDGVEQPPIHGVEPFIDSLCIGHRRGWLAVSSFWWDKIWVRQS